MSSISRILSNTFYLTLDWLVLTLGGYLYWILISKTLTVSEIGKFSTILNISLFLAGISGIGMNIAVTKLFPEYQLKNDHRSIQGTISWTLKKTTMVALSVGLFFVLISWILTPSTFGLSNLNDAVLVAVVMVFINSIYMTTSYLFGLQKMKELFLSDAFITTTKILITLPLILVSFSYLGPVLGFLAASIATFVLRLRWLPTGERKADENRVYLYSNPVFISIFGLMAVNQGSIVLLGILSTPVNVGLFSILFYIASPIRMIPQLISQGMFPTSAQKWVSNETQNIKTMIVRSIKYSLFLIIPIILSLSIFSKEIIILLTTSEYITVSGNFLYISLAYLFLGIATIFNNMLYSAGEVRSYTISNIFGGFVNVSAGFFAIVKFGIFGALLAFLFSAFSMMIISFYLLRKKISFEIGIGYVAKLTAAAAAFFLISNSLSIAYPFSWILKIIIASSIYLSLLLVLRFFDKLDIRVLEELESRFSGNNKAIIRNLKRFLNKFTY